MGILGIIVLVILWAFFRGIALKVILNQQAERTMDETVRQLRAAGKLKE